MATVSWLEGTLPANGITIHYYQSSLGSDSAVSSLSTVSSVPSALPILIFLHGLLANSGMLQPVAAVLAASFQVILPDARGHAGSKPTPANSFTVANMVTDVVSLISHVAPSGEPVFLMGHGMGASVAARVAKAHPQLVRAVLLETPPWAALPFEKSLIPEGALTEPLTAGSKRGSATFVTHDIAQKGGACAALTQEASEKLLQAVTLLQRKSEEEFMALAMSGRFSQLEMGSMEAQLSFDLKPCRATFAQVMAEDCEAVAGIAVPARVQVAPVKAGLPSTQLGLELARHVVQSWTAGSLSYFGDGGRTLHIPPTEEDWLADVLKFFKDLAVAESE